MKENKYYSPEMSDREILDMLAEIFGVSVGDSYRHSEEA